MKQQKLTGYTPTYPRKVLRSAALTAAALVAMSNAAGCVRVKVSEPVQTEGIVTIFEPAPEVLVLDGEVAIPEITEEPVFQGKIALPEPTEEELVLDGDVAICEPTPAPELTTTGMVYVPEDNGQH